MFLFDLIHGNNKILMKGGGGSSGAVSFPEYMQDRHEDWLGTAAISTFNVSSLINADLAGVANPLEGLSYEDPATKETALQTSLNAFKTLANNADADVDYSAAVAEAVAEVDTEGFLKDIDITPIVEAARTQSATTIQTAITSALDAIDEGKVYQAVQAFINIRRKDRAELVTRYKAGMANANAERSSSYAIGLALLEIDFERETSAYQTELSTQMYQQGLQVFASVFTAELELRVRSAQVEKTSRDTILSQSIQLHLGYQQFIFELLRNTVNLEGEVNRLNFVMDSEYVGNTADLNWKHSSWKWNVYANAVGVLGGIGGGTFVPEGPSKASSAIGGAMSGAAAGMTVGGPAGAAIGGVLGGLAGLL